MRAGSSTLERLAHVLHPQEIEYAENLATQARGQEFLLGRIAAKVACQDFCGIREPRELNIVPGSQRQPVVRGDWPGLPSVSISHASRFFTAVAFPSELGLGVDVEILDPDQTEVFKDLFTSQEINLINDFPPEVGLTLLWSVKESLAKSLQVGFTRGIENFELSRVVRVDQNLLGFDFKHYPGHRGLAWIYEGYVVSLCLPSSCHLLKSS